MTLWSANHAKIKVINTPTVLYITPISMVCFVFYSVQCNYEIYVMYAMTILWHQQ